MDLPLLITSSLAMLSLRSWLESENDSGTFSFYPGFYIFPHFAFFLTHMFKQALVQAFLHTPTDPEGLKYSAINDLQCANKEAFSRSSVYSTMSFTAPSTSFLSCDHFAGQVKQLP